MARAPERNGYVIVRACVGVPPLMSCSRAPIGEVLLQAIHQAERRCVPDRRLCSTFDQPTSGFPLAEANCIVQWRATGDNRTGRFDVSASVEQGIQCLNIVAASCPVQRPFLMRPVAVRVHISTLLDECGDRLANIRKVTWPVDCRANERIRKRLSIASGTASNRGIGQAGVFRQQTSERIEVADANCSDGRHGWRFVFDEAHQISRRRSPVRASPVQADR